MNTLHVMCTYDPQGHHTSFPYIWFQQYAQAVNKEISNIHLHVNREIVNACLCLHVRCWTCTNIFILIVETATLLTWSRVGICGGGGGGGGGRWMRVFHHHVLIPPPFLLSLLYLLLLTSSCSSSSSSLQIFDVCSMGKSLLSILHAVRVIHYCSESL